MASYRELIDRYKEREPLYARLVEKVVALVDAELKRAAIEGTVTGRVKTPKSFATKAIMMGYDDPEAAIGDRAGVRITLAYHDDIERATELVREVLHVINCESKLDALAYDEFGYLGVHCDARLRDEAAAEDEDLTGLRVEVQIRTMVQSAWAEVSHEQLYKPAADVSDDLKRQIHRLVALVELFDLEISRFMSSAQELPGYRESRALVPLAEELMTRFDVRARPDRSLSRVVAAAVVPLYGVEPEALYQERLRGWIDENEEALRVQFEEAAAISSNPLFVQPEIFLIFERLSNDQARLENDWPEELPRAWYQELAEAWGTSR